MSRWFRVYDDMVDDPKVQRLSADLFRALVNLWCMASKNGGTLPCLGDIAYTLRIRQDRVVRMLEELKECELLDGDDTLTPHNWSKRQYKSDVTDPTAADRQQKYRDKKRNATVTPTVTPTVTGKRPETEQNRTETEKIESSPKRVRTIYSDDFENLFWKPYPTTPIMAKKEAFREWQKLTPEQRSTACSAVPGFIAFLKANPTHSVVHACRFLSQGRGEGFKPEAPSERVIADMAARGWSWISDRWQKTEAA
jgi:hypothetical protein